MLDVEKELSRFSFIRELDVLDVTNHSIDSDGLRKAIELYNQAIESIRSESDDIAAIELKKAISIYPEFMEAKVLLSLCYILRQQVEQAEELLKSIINSDNYIARAHQYLQYINELKQKGGKNKNKLISQSLFKPKIDLSRFQKSFLKISVIFFAGVLVSYIFFYSSLANLRQHSDAQVSRSNSIKSDYQEKIDLYKSEFSTAQKNIELLKQQLEEKDNEFKYLSNVKKLLEIEQLINNGDKEKAAEGILSLKDFKFNDVEQQKYQALYEKIIPQLAAELYYKGYNLYKAGKYGEAIDIFNKVLGYNIKNDQYQYALYLIAKCYQFQGDNINAASYYNQLINYFPASKYAKYAANRLNELQKN